MREVAGAARIVELMRRLGQAVREETRIYLVGGASAVLVEATSLRDLFGTIRPALYRYPALDPAALAGKLEAALKAHR